jgi:RNA polymerase sigma-70 factor (ECF subfamily)
VEAGLRRQREVAVTDDAAVPSVHAVPSFDALFVTEYPKMVALAAAVSGSRAHAEDIAQDAMGRLNRNWPKVQGYDNPGAWLRRITINLALSQRRRLLTEAKALLRVGAPQPALAPPDPGDGAVWTAVAELPKNQRAAVALHFLEDRSIAEIADILDIAPSTARVHLHRARQTLRDRLTQEDRP